MNFRRFSITNSFGNHDNVDGAIDELMSYLHPEQSLLEEKCQRSLVTDQTISSSPRSSRVRSRHVMVSLSEHGRDPEEVLQNLPQQYFVPGNDPVLQHLEEISSWEEDDIIQKFMMKIEETDMEKDVIIEHLTSMIDSNYDSLMSCMSHVRDISLELCQAEMQIQHARTRIHSADTILLNGLMRIKQLQKKREELVSILETIRSIKTLVDVYKTMEKKLQTGEIGEAAEYASGVYDYLKSGSFGSFRALNDIKNSIQRCILSIEEKGNKALNRLSCRKFNCLEYDSILKAFLLLDRIVNDLVGSGDSQTYLESMQCMEGLVQRISKFQLDDIDACLHVAVMEHIVVGQHRKQMAADVEQLSHSISASSSLNYREMVDFTEMPLNLLYRKLSADSIPACVVRSCELLADIIHTHFLLTQWHYRPFSADNHDWQSIHTPRKFPEFDGMPATPTQISPRSGSTEAQGYPEDDDEEDEEDEETDMEVSLSGTAPKASLNLRPASVLLTERRLVHVANRLKAEYSNQSTAAPTLREEEFVLLAMLLMKLVQSRTIVWDEISRALTMLLRMISFSSQVKLEDFVEMMRALETMLVLGRDFCGSESLKLKDCLKEKSAEFFRSFHQESFAIIRVMVETEQWQAVAVTGSVLDLMKTIIARDYPGVDIKISEGDKSRSNVESSLKGEGLVHIEDEANDSLLSKFSKIGNPFSEMFCSKRECVESKDESSSTLLKGVVAATDILNLLQGEINKITSKRDVNVEPFIVTQTVLNGLAKYCMKYLNMMIVVPTEASELLGNLLQLFDYYLCSVFSAFVPPDDRAKFLSSSSRMTACAPDLARDFEILQSYLERCLDEMVVISVKPNASVDSLQTSSTGDLPAGDHANATIGTTLNSPGFHSDQTVGNKGGNLLTSLSVEAVKLSTLINVQDISSTATATSCFALAERVVAAESCIFASQILVEIKPILLKILNPSSVNKCEQYVEQVRSVTRQLSSLLFRSTCSQLIPQSSTLSTILDCAWEVKKLREGPHDWVEKLVSSCQLVWEQLNSSNELRDASSLLKEQVWLEVCQYAFDIVLEAFSKVRRCSSEGRAMMTMDLYALHEGLNLVHLCRPPRGKHYIDNYLRAFYLSEDSLTQWVEENWQSYAYRHIHGLLNQTLSSSMLTNKKFKDAVAHIDNLYEFEKKDNIGKVSGMFSQRLKEENKFSNLLTGKFRR